MKGAPHISSLFATPRDGIERVLFEAAWQNERLINVVRIVFCFALGVPSVIANVTVSHVPPLFALPIVAWGLVAIALVFGLRRFYHRTYSFLFSTIDLTLILWAQDSFYGQMRSAGFPDSPYILGSLTALGMLIVAANMLRFSWPIAAWSVAYAIFLNALFFVRATGIMQDVYWTSLTYVFLGGLLILTARRLRQVLVRARERDSLARFLPRQAVDRVARDPGQLNLVGELQEATVLFSDIRGFTALSSAARPEKVVAMLNEYFAEMVDELFRWEGTLDKFIGDGMAAVFPPPLAPADQARRAIKCALGMARRLEALNQRRRARGEPALRIGIGIHSGTVLAGSIGSAERMEYTHIGDVMNTCSRIEGLTKELGQPILASQSTVDQAGSIEGVRLAAMPPATVRGKEEALQVYAVSAAG